jgi:lysophospholipid acyltransferase (LPLAT)-like uncharacterized protein
VTATPEKKRDDWRLRIGVPVGVVLLRMLAATWRVERHGDVEWARVTASGKGSVLALWHGQLFPLAWVVRDMGLLVLVSEHRDGEIITRILENLGYTMIRGSSTRGGARALAEMIRALKSGRSIAITPDGPKGPARVFSPGAAVAAQRAEVPVFPLYCSVSSAWRFNSWDRFMIPKPFARVVVHLGEPTLVRGSTPAEAGEDAPRLGALIDPGGGSHG